MNKLCPHCQRRMEESYQYFDKKKLVCLHCRDKPEKPRKKTRRATVKNDKPEKLQKHSYVRSVSRSLLYRKIK